MLCHDLAAVAFPSTYQRKLWNVAIKPSPKKGDLTLTGCHDDISIVEVPTAVCSQCVHVGVDQKVLVRTCGEP